MGGGQTKSLSVSGFTLAEVLITLGIIGIVAAMTLPVLTKKYQEVVLRNQFKKGYSMLSQAVIKAQSDWGGMPSCYRRTYSLVPTKCSNYNSLGVCTSSTQLDGSPVPKNQTGEVDDCPQFWPLVRKQIKIIKTCDKNSLQKGCIPQYKGRDEIAQESQSAKPGDDDYMDDYGKQMIAGCAIWTKSQLDNTTASYVLADGSIIISAYNGDKGTSFAYDVNGKKGPNKWGYDIFVMAIRNNARTGQASISQLIVGAGDCMTAESGGKLTADMIKSLYK